MARRVKNWLDAETIYRITAPDRELRRKQRADARNVAMAPFKPCDNPKCSENSPCSDECRRRLARSLAKDVSRGRIR